MKLATLVPAVALAFLCLSASAMRNPASIEREQDSTPEFLTITVRSVKATLKEGTELLEHNVAVEAEVKEVHRTKTGVVPGQVIFIWYVAKDYKPGGPHPVGESFESVLTQGRTYPAYLRKDKDWYRAAVSGFSFSTMKRGK